MNNDQKAHFYADRSIKSIERISEQEYLRAKKIYYCKAYIYFYKAWIYLKQNQPDLAFPFIQTAYDEALKEEHGYVAPFLEIYGDYYQQTKNYSKSIDYYLQAINNKKSSCKHLSMCSQRLPLLIKCLGNMIKKVCI